ncbi:MAG: beta-lactamase family protein, partial [Acidobacteria bacterium]|nr:beta-lactamase family protein [Acidobacteriota bacterium]
MQGIEIRMDPSRAAGGYRRVQVQLAGCLLSGLLALSSAAGAEGPRACALETATRSRAVSFLEEQHQELGTPGLSAAVWQRGQLVFSEAFGMADVEHQAAALTTTVYNVGSVSKAITAVAVMQLVESGKVHLDDPIQCYVPSFPVKPWPVTVRHLMTHTSGIRHYRVGDFPGDPVNDLNHRPYSSIEEAIAIFKDDALLFPPGS